MHKLRTETRNAFKRILQETGATILPGMKNPSIIEDGALKVFCYSPIRNEVDAFIVDLVDLPIISNNATWVTNVRKHDKSKRVTCRLGSLNKLLMNTSAGMTIDHINRDTLDNRRRNLREVTIGVNVLNKGTYKNSTTGIPCVHKDGDVYRVAFIRRYKNKETAEAISKEIIKIFDKYNDLIETLENREVQYGPLI